MEEKKYDMNPEMPDVPMHETGETMPDSREIEREVDIYDIHITDEKAPVVILFGPKSSGKSMTLVRLARYLHKFGYSVKPDTRFKSDAHYQKLCDDFVNTISAPTAKGGTSYTDFMLVKVMKAGRVLCQILEAPGEDFFSPEDISALNIQPYLSNIFNTIPNRRIWAFITEAEWRVDHRVLDAYVRRIGNCKNQLAKRGDSFIILYNKIDLLGDQFMIDGNLLVKQAERHMLDEFRPINTYFQNQNPISRLWKKHTYRFVPFSTGTYMPSERGVLRYTESYDIYPRSFWNALLKLIRG